MEIRAWNEDLGSKKERVSTKDMYRDTPWIEKDLDKGDEHDTGKRRAWKEDLGPKKNVC